MNEAIWLSVDTVPFTSTSIPGALKSPEAVPMLRSGAPWETAMLIGRTRVPEGFPSVSFASIWISYSPAPNGKLLEFIENVVEVIPELL